MNKLYNILIIVFVVSLFGCNDDFLDRPAKDIITSENFWKSAKDLELYVNQFYEKLPAYKKDDWSAGIYWYDQNTDNMVKEMADQRLLGNYTVVSENGKWNFNQIRNVNTFFANYEKVTEPFNAYKHYLGEAYFFRAFFNFELLKQYGSFPYTEKVLDRTSPELYMKQTPRDICAEKIIGDLDKAIEYMKSGPNCNGNRLNKEIAQLLKGRVALYEGTWEKYHAGTDFGVKGSDGSDFLKIAEEVSFDLIESGVYQIHNTGAVKKDYFNLFGQTNLSGNKEVMLWRQFDASLGLAHNAQNYLSQSGGGRGLTKQLIDDYLCIDGKPIAVSNKYEGDANLTNVSTNRDPRLAQTIWIPGEVMEVRNGTITKYFEKATLGGSGDELCPTGYQLRKGSNPDYAHRSETKTCTTTSPIFRYAEALLIYAEARAEQGKLTQDDVDITINKLRARAGMPNLVIANITNDPNWIFPDLSPIINEIRRERRIEFAAEGYRFDDLARWAAHDEVTKGKRFLGCKFVQEDYENLVIGKDINLNEDGYIDPHVGDAPTGYGFDLERDYLLPVPPTQITQNKELDQNPGWL